MASSAVHLQKCQITGFNCTFILLFALLISLVLHQMAIDYYAFFFLSRLKGNLSSDNWYSTTFFVMMKVM